MIELLSSANFRIGQYNMVQHYFDQPSELQFSTQVAHVGRSNGKKYDKYTISTMKYPPRKLVPKSVTLKVKAAVGSLVVTASDSRPAGLGSMPNATKYPPIHAEIVEGEISVVSMYHPFGEFRQAKSYCHLYGAQGVPLAPCYDEFRGS
ncbi:hypothetical protein TNCV_416551 [Trichonephila clavipes]|nr:hypothetical protein TNCV_416551 [Trichonephila clavipes]